MTCRPFQCVTVAIETCTLSGDANVLKIISDTAPNFQFSASYFFPRLRAARRTLDLAVRLLPPPCGVLDAPKAGAGVGAAKGLADVPTGAKLKPPLGAGAAGTAEGAVACPNCPKLLLLTEDPNWNPPVLFAAPLKLKPPDVGLFAVAFELKLNPPEEAAAFWEGAVPKAFWVPALSPNPPKGELEAFCDVFAAKVNDFWLEAAPKALWVVF